MCILLALTGEQAAKTLRLADRFSNGLDDELRLSSARNKRHSK